MNLNHEGAVTLARGVGAAAGDGEVDVLVCPTFVHLAGVVSAVEGSKVAVGGQDVYFEGNGAFTGETSTEMLCDVGCTYVILGHSERRNVIGETDKLINQKLHSALAARLRPILCVGELLEEREAERTMEVGQSQMDGALEGVSEEQMASVVIAYEPVWAIGTGKTASPEQAQEVHADLRSLLASRYNQAIADGVRILYGGSVKPANAADLMSCPDIDGALVGGASLKADSFAEIIAAAGE